MNSNKYRNSHQEIKITSYTSRIFDKVKETKYQKRLALFTFLFMVFQVFSPFYSFVAKKKAMASTASSSLIHTIDVATGYDGDFTGKTNVAVDGDSGGDGTYGIKFSEAMKASTITADNIHFKTYESVASHDVAIPCSVSYNTSTHVAQINPDSNLNHYANYYLFVSSDVLNANSTKHFSLSGIRDKTKFRTVPTSTADSVHPTITMVTPSATTGVAKNTNVVMRFSEELGKDSSNHFWDPTAGTYVVLENSADEPVTTVKSYNSDTHLLTLNPASDLTNLGQYKVAIGAGLTDMKGNTLTIPTSLPQFTVAADTTAPTITAVSVSSLRTTSVKVNWMTNEDSDSVVCYSESATGPFTDTCTTATDTSPMVPNHSVTVTGLTLSTKYYYVVKSTDGASPTPNTASTATNPATLNFTTAATDPPTPTIDSPGPHAVATDTDATISWTTGTDTSSQVCYGTKSGVWGTCSDVTNTSPRVQDHSVTLTGLQTNVQYFYIVKSLNSALGEVISSEATFTTLAQYTLAVNIESAKGSLTVDGTPATLTSNRFTNTYDSGTSVDLAVTPTNTAFQFSGWVCGDDNSTDSNYQVTMNSNVTCTVSFGAKGGSSDTTPPAITDVHATPLSSTSVIISWATSGEASSSQVCYGTTEGGPFGTCTTETNLNPKVTTHSVTVSRLTADTEYFFVVKSKDAATTPNTATSGQNSFILASGTAGTTYDVTPDSTTVTKNGVTLIFRTFPSSVAGMDIIVTPSNSASQPAPTGKTLIKLYDISAVDQDGTAVESGFTANATLTYSGAQSGDTVMYWDGSQWSTAGISNVAVDPATGAISFDTTHFSQYAVLASATTTTTGGTTGGSTDASGTGSDAESTVLPDAGGNTVNIILNLILTLAMYLVFSRLITRSKFGKILN